MIVRHNHKKSLKQYGGADYNIDISVLDDISIEPIKQFVSELVGKLGYELKLDGRYAQETDQDQENDQEQSGFIENMIYKEICDELLIEELIYPKKIKITDIIFNNINKAFIHGISDLDIKSYINSKYNITKPNINTYTFHILIEQ